MYYRYQSINYSQLPARIRLSNGDTRTSLNELSESELVDLGIEILEGTYPPPPTIEELKAQRFSELSMYRYSKEIAGVVLNGVMIKTDLESKVNLNGAVSRAMLRPDSSVNWKISDTVWITLPAVQIIETGLAVSDYFEDCFNCNKTHALAINALTTIEEVQNYDFTIGWPS